MSVVGEVVSTDWSAVVVPVRWLLDQADLSLRLRTVSAGLTAEITFAVTTELPDPARWLSGGELILTTGLGLPDDPALRTAYIHGLHKIGVTAVGFWNRTDLLFDTVPPELGSSPPTTAGWPCSRSRWPPRSSRWPRRS